jgi:hypothetical protein
MIDNPPHGEREHPEIEPDDEPGDREPGPDDRPSPSDREPEPGEPEGEPEMWAPGADGPPAARAPTTPDR